MPFFNSTLSEHDLVQGCSRNDRRTQELLYKQYCGAMLVLCRSYTKSEEDAVEVLQDGFLKIFQQIENRVQGIFMFLSMLELVQQKFLKIIIGEGRNNFIVEYNETEEGMSDIEHMQLI